MRILIVEDNKDFYNDYLIRLFNNILPMDKLEIVHASTVAEVLFKINDWWDVILMDYFLGKSVTELGGKKIKDGADLVKIRRVIESKSPNPASFIMGISNNQVSNRMLISAGADTSFLKICVIEMAQEIEQRL